MTVDYEKGKCVYNNGSEDEFKIMYSRFNVCEGSTDSTKFNRYIMKGAGANGIAGADQYF